MPARMPQHRRTSPAVPDRLVRDVIALQRLTDQRLPARARVEDALGPELAHRLLRGAAPRRSAA